MKKTIKIAIVALLVLMLGMTVCQANSFTFTAVPSATTLGEGEEVTIDFGIANINVGENGINSVSGYLAFDENIFEAVTDVTSLNNWSFQCNTEKGNAEYGKFLGVNISQGITATQTIGRVKLKVKTGLRSTTTAITLKKLSTTDGENMIYDQDKTISIAITGSVTDPVNNTTTGNTVNNTTNNTTGNTVNNTNTNKNTVQNITTNKKDGKLPAAGTTAYTVIGIAVIAIVAIALVSYFRYRNIDK